MSNLKNMKKTMANKKDEYYTPEILVRPLLKYLPKHSLIWCPFDTGNSEYVLILRGAGYNVVYSHLANGDDFLEMEPPKHCDLIISNPPFTIKKKVL